MRRFANGQSNPHRRHGALFHYYMIYMLMSGLLLTAAGTCLHAILSTDRNEQLQARQLQALLRLNRMLHEDTASGNVILSADGELQISQSGDVTTVWQAQGHQLRRVQKHTGEVVSTQQVALLPGTSAAFVADSAAGMIVLVVVDRKQSQQGASQTPEPSEPSEPSEDLTPDVSTVAAGNTIRILCSVLPPGAASAAANPTLRADATQNQGEISQ